MIRGGGVLGRRKAEELCSRRLIKSSMNLGTALRSVPRKDYERIGRRVSEKKVGM